MICHSLAALIIIVLFATAAPTYAVPVTVSFTASDFSDFNGNAPPTTTVSGVIVYESSDINAPITGLLSIMLSAGGHDFALAETGFVNIGINSESIIGGTFNQANGIGINSTDFLLQFQRGPNPFPVLPLFSYAVAGVNGAAACSTLCSRMFRGRSHRVLEKAGMRFH